MDATRTASFRPVARAGVIAAGIAVFLLAIASVPAAAATVIGSAAGNQPCGSGMDTVQLSSSSSTSYAAPAGGGVITSWSTQVGAITGQAALLVWRPTATAGTLTLVGESPHVALTASTMNTFNLAAPITVNAGDLLGLRVESLSYCIQSGAATGSTIGYKLGATPGLGLPETLALDPLNLTLDVSATLGTVAPPVQPTPTPTPTSKPTPPPGPPSAPKPTPGTHDRDSHHDSDHPKPAGHKAHDHGHSDGSGDGQDSKGGDS